MKFVFFYHSLISDWNHGNAHFLRGIASELLARGQRVAVYEPADGWSLSNLLAEYGERAVRDFHAAYPALSSHCYHLDRLKLEQVLEDADVVLVHEWNDTELVRRIGHHRAAHGGYRLLFHDTHHRAQTAPEQMAAYDLSHYDGVLAFGAVIRDLYLDQAWAARAWTWHEAADVRRFRPYPNELQEGDLIWIGNWGDEERTQELHEFLLAPVSDLKLKARVYGVRYPQQALEALREAGIEYGGWLPNYRVPIAFARFRVTVHIPRRPYAQALPGIPTIRPFEALACAIPLISAPWEDTEGLFSPGKDFLIARHGAEMRAQLRELLNDSDLARSLAEHGLETIRARHTCAHRVDELFTILQELNSPAQSIRGAH